MQNLKNFSNYEEWKMKVKKNATSQRTWEISFRFIKKFHALHYCCIYLWFCGVYETPLLTLDEDKKIWELPINKKNLDYHIQVLTGSALYLLVETSAVSTAVQPSFFCGHGSTMAVPQKQTDMLIADHLFGQLLIDWQNPFGTEGPSHP